MSQVALLDPLVAQQVAAGEVVDRPASVVKELSENALDAGATRVEVEIADGGRERMLVRDDGSGMSEEDAKLSDLRHPTSKIHTASDVESVMTLDFRGEAFDEVIGSGKGEHLAALLQETEHHVGMGYGELVIVSTMAARSARALLRKALLAGTL